MHQVNNELPDKRKNLLGFERTVRVRTFRLRGFPPHVADTLPHAVVKPRAPRSLRKS